MVNQGNAMLVTYLAVARQTHDQKYTCLVILKIVTKLSAACFYIYLIPAVKDVSSVLDKKGKEAGISCLLLETIAPCQLPTICLSPRRLNFFRCRRQYFLLSSRLQRPGHEARICDRSHI